MAGRAGRVRAMLLQPRAQRQRLHVLGVFFERRHLGRRLRRRRAEEIVENPLAANDRRGPGRVRRHGQDAGVAEQAAAALVGHRDPTEPIPDHIRNLVVPRQPAVDERVVGRQQLEDRPVFAHDAHEEQLGFALHRRPSGSGRCPETRTDPGASRAGCAGAATATRSCSPARRRAGRPASAAPAARAPPARSACRRLARWISVVIGNAAPQKEREARRQLQIADAVDRSRRGAGRRALEPKHEFRIRQDRLERRS